EQIRDNKSIDMIDQIAPGGVALLEPEMLAHIAFMLEEDFRAGNVIVTKHEAAKPAGKRGAATPERHGAFAPADRKQLAVQQAYEKVLAATGIVDVKDKFQVIVDSLSDRRDDVTRDETQRRSKAKAKVESDRQAREDKAREEVERQTRIG